ncbi:MAG: hypothetical protein MOIL_00442 [Candidatus Methanolliviera sp. GoM_oil]|nr:MAG: hypothetical protein MOIL_00442 [Candidatus Methanolliviera sp. GoM_oil]
MTAKDSNCGDLYTLTAMNVESRLFIGHHEGGRSIDDAIELFMDVDEKREKNSQIPVFTSDNWDAFKDGLVYVYGKLKTPPYKGTGRRPDPVIVPSDDLKYAQVCKKRRNGKIVEVVQRVVFGDPDEVLEILCGDSDGKINTSYVERLNLTIRNSLARFIRRTMNESKDPVMHSRALDFIQAWYNFVKPHRSLRVEENDGRRKWRQRTPAMAEGLTDHIWSLEEMFTFRVPVQ